MSRVKSIYINLPINNLEQSRVFWTKLGFSFEENFSDEKALCMILNDGTMYSMLIGKEYYQTFTDRPIANGSTTQVLIAIEVESKEKVDEIVKLALENGGSRYKESVDHSWMYYDSFADIDGHQWEVMFTDMSKMPA